MNAAKFNVSFDVLKNVAENSKSLEYFGVGDASIPCKVSNGTQVWSSIEAYDKSSWTNESH